jgi:hypothetical protein
MSYHLLYTLTNVTQVYYYRDPLFGAARLEKQSRMPNILLRNAKHLVDDGMI